MLDYTVEPYPDGHYIRQYASDPPLSHRPPLST